jgi:acyl carrier protein
MSDVLTIVVDLVEQVTGVDATELADGTRFERLAGWTSLEALRLLTAVEQRFGVGLDLREYFAASTLADLVALIHAGLADAGQRPA